jgi:ATP-dependent Clp endopeptidase proteolytic subunit ClpP
MGKERELTTKEIDAAIKKAEAEAEKSVAEAEKAIAEARKTRIEADALDLSLTKAKYDADRETEKRKAELADNKFHHVYIFDQQVNEASVKACTKQLAAWERGSDDEKPITVQLVINSPGGDVVEGFALIDYIRGMQTRGHTVNTVAYGMAASMGGVLLQVGNSRIMGQNAVLLIHEAQFGAVGSYGEIEDRVKLVNIFHDRILNLFADRAHVSKAFIKRNWNRKDWWLGAETALKHGFVDEVS